MSDQDIEEISAFHFRAPNLLCADGDLEGALQLSCDARNLYSPLVTQRYPTVATVIHNTEVLSPNDPEYNIVRRALSRGSMSFSYTQGDIECKQVCFNHVLNLPNTARDVRFRQDAVREVADNPELFNYLATLMACMQVYLWEEPAGVRRRKPLVRLETTPEKVDEFTKGLLLLERIAKSPAFQRAYQWAEQVGHDTIFQELFRQKRRVTDSRLVAVFSERFAGMKYGILKPGIRPEDIFDFLARETSHVSVTREGTGHKIISEEIDVVKYKTGGDREAVELAVGQARQRMDSLNKISSDALTVPMYLVYRQLQHILHGADLHRAMQKQGYSAVFPEISDEPFVFRTKGILPLRLVLENLVDIGNNRSPKHKRLCPNDLGFSEDDRMIQAEGANRRGKSEAWRTIHLSTLLVNSGYSVPARSLEAGVIPQSHFISCKGESGHGGSEFERGMVQAVERLREVYPGSRVVLDELGDATNRHTALAVARRLLPVLLSRGCQVFVTSHHDALTDYIRKELNGKSFMPSPNARGMEIYALVPSQGEVDFRPEATLDEMKLTERKLAKILPRTKRNSAPRSSPVDDTRHESGREYEDPF